VVYKVNPKIHTCRYDDHIEIHEDDDIYQEEIEGHQSLTVSDEAGLTELATGDAKLLEEVSCPSKKCIQKSKRLFERKEKCE
jgi:hypothetical protein